MRYLKFEKPMIELDGKIEELIKFSEKENIDVSFEINNMKQKLEDMKKNIYLNLSSWERIQIARHPERPYTMDYINDIFTKFIVFHGDRCFSEDKAMVTGIGEIEGNNVAVIGHQKGRETTEKLERNFGCAHPEGYRKALRIMKLAERFNMPIITFIDTPGAYPGIGAEERGQAEAIAVNIREMFSLKVPIIVVIIGEGGSGGALGIGIGDVICILENAYYSVISPEGCAAILWKDPAKSNLAAEALKLTPKDLLKLGIVDEVIPEPLGGAHKDFKKISNSLRDSLLNNLNKFKNISENDLLNTRYEKFRKLGVYSVMQSVGSEYKETNDSSENSEHSLQQAHNGVERVDDPR
ncbi:MAG: acetyl-CoA carboxylase carboxyltransferase subunit alpha [Candidatus Aureabacteria bacterium]|nr:acetyl-CoA carboxylase carboxyltransferase subunit alpha [Candidatus Auribacterota bacterium]